MNDEQFWGSAQNGKSGLREENEWWTVFFFPLLTSCRWVERNHVVFPSLFWVFSGDNQLSSVWIEVNAEEKK